jgi:hypothetical protein
VQFETFAVANDKPTERPSQSSKEGNANVDYGVSRSHFIDGKMNMSK